MSTWQKTLSQGFSTSKELLEFLNLPVGLVSEKAEQAFKTRVPRAFAERMQPGDPQDPLLLQVLASPWEEDSPTQYLQDPLEEQAANPIPGLLHKYPGRALLILTGACAINCRFCFRRHFPYQDNNPGRDGWDTVIHYIRADASIYEVILSGGDPLLATDAVLGPLIEALNTIPHLKYIRFHTRIPIVLPERVTAGLLNLIKHSALKTIMVLHCNHPREIDARVKDVCKQLVAAGCQLLNQSVLLRGINDKAPILAALSHALFDCQVMPYYLHLLDKVAGAAHFDMPIDEALAIYHTLQTQLPGYLLPKLVREEPGRASKSLVI